jgi:kynurenine formamidase
VPLSEELQAIASRVSNWGRWGDDDERGTANLIDEAALRRGLACVRDGQAFPLAIPLDQNGPQLPGGAPGRIDPIRTMLCLNQIYTGQPGDAAFNDDMVVLSMSSGTHIDSLAHVTYDGQMYNGYTDSEVTAEGAARCGTDKLGPILSRGVLLDVARVKGVDRLEPGYPITAADLDAAVAQSGVELAPGDVLLVRTGQIQLLHKGKVWDYNHDSPGLSAGTIEWIHGHDVGAIFTDTYIFEVWPPEDWSQMMCVHMVHLRDMGQVQGQNFDFEALAAACADDGRHDCFFSAVPEPFTAACSAPVAPVAVR